VPKWIAFSRSYRSISASSRGAIPITAGYIDPCYHSVSYDIREYLSKPSEKACQARPAWYNRINSYPNHLVQHFINILTYLICFF
jgi:hypothetical protein